MSEKEIKDMMNLIDAGLKLAEERILQEKSLRGENVVIYTESKGCALSICSFTTVLRSSTLKLISKQLHLFEHCDKKELSYYLPIPC